MTVWKLFSEKDIHNLDVIRTHVRACADLGEADVAQRFALIGDVLQDNIDRLDIDEEINQLFYLANCIAGELLSKEVQAIHYPGGAWGPRRGHPDGAEFRLKKDGRNADFGAVMPKEKQKNGMTKLIVYLLRLDPELHAGAAKLERYAEDKQLWTREDSGYLYD